MAWLGGARLKDCHLKTRIHTEGRVEAIGPRPGFTNPDSVAPRDGPAMSGAKAHAEDFIPINGFAIHVDERGHSFKELRVGLQDMKDRPHLEGVFSFASFNLC